MQIDSNRRHRAEGCGWHGPLPGRLRPTIRANEGSGENPNGSSSSSAAAAAAAAAAAGRAHASAPATSLERCVSVPGACAVAGPGHLSNSRNTRISTRRPNGGDDGDSDNDSESVSSAVQEVQTHLERSGGATGHADLATHLEIEYLAEATLVEAEPADATSSCDDRLGHSRSSRAPSSPARSAHHNASSTPRIDEEGGQGGENEDGPASLPFNGAREDDTSTLGPPPEILAEQQQQGSARAQRRASNDGTHATAADTVHGSTVHCSRQEELIGPDRIEDMSTREFLCDEDAMADAPQP